MSAILFACTRNNLIFYHTSSIVRPGIRIGKSATSAISCLCGMESDSDFLILILITVLINTMDPADDAGIAILI